MIINRGFFLGGWNQFVVQHKTKSMFGGLDSVNVQTDLKQSTECIAER